MAVSLLLVSCSRKTTETDYGQWKLVTQKGGQSLGYSPNSGVKLIKSGGYFFKDLNRNGKLDAYEDWRKPVDERAKDLASQLSKEEIAGLMLYSAHQAVPSDTISEAQKKFLTEDNVRHVLVTSVGSSEIAAKWSNNVQALVEGLGHDRLGRRQAACQVDCSRKRPARAFRRCAGNHCSRKERSSC